MPRIRRTTTRAAIAAIALIAVVGHAGSAAQEMRAPFVDEEFSSTARPSGGGWGLWGWGTTNAGHAGGSLRTFMNEGERGAAGGSIDLRVAAGRPLISEAYLRYWLWLDPGFELATRDTTKLPGLAGLNGTYRCLGGKLSIARAPCWSGRTIATNTSRETGPLPTGTLRLGTYLYHLDVPLGYRPYGEPVLWDEDGGTIETGRWICIEQHVRMNTPGERDGVVRAWVDEQRVLNRSDVRFRRAGERTLGVQTAWLDLYHGGRGVSPRDNEVRVDSLMAGPQRIGCSDAAQHRGTFHDDDRSVHEASIEALVAAGVTRGCDARRPTRFCPTDPVTRGQFAMILSETLGLPEGDTAFADVTGDRGRRAVGALVRADVTRGCTPEAFCPSKPLTRAEVATFLARLLDLPVAAELLPLDISGNSPLSGGVTAVLADGIMDTCAPDRFCPDGPVTRELLADVVARVRGRG